LYLHGTLIQNSLKKEWIKLIFISPEMQILASARKIAMAITIIWSKEFLIMYKI